jgi:hypothetical protein
MQQCSVSLLATSCMYHRSDSGIAAPKLPGDHRSQLSSPQPFMKSRPWDELRLGLPGEAPSNPHAGNRRRRHSRTVRQCRTGGWSASDIDASLEAGCSCDMLNDCSSTGLSVHIEMDVARVVSQAPEQNHKARVFSSQDKRDGCGRSMWRS